MTVPEGTTPDISIMIGDALLGRLWLDRLQEIHEAYYVAMQEATDTLEDMKNFAEGTIVDELVAMAYALFRASQIIHGGMEDIAETILKHLGLVDGFITDSRKIVDSTINKIFG